MPLQRGLWRKVSFMAIGGKIRYGIPEARLENGPRALGYLNLSGGLDLITITA
jgi:hypothetical protein